MPNPIASLNQTIDSYEKSPLDPIAEQEIKRKIKHWKKIERGLEENMQLVKSEMHDLKSDMHDMKKTVEHIEQKVIHVQQDTTKIKQDVQYVQQVAKEATENVKHISQEATERKHDVRRCQHILQDTRKEEHDTTEGMEYFVQFFQYVLYIYFQILSRYWIELKCSYLK